ncbi:SLBB domain-containing protein [bacterium]|nr:SLBB domain-containing protein [bacterium]
MLRSHLAWSFLFLIVLAGPAASQPTSDSGYLLGADKRLQIVVHILGEVEKPGEYLVPDDTDVLELISKAGGPTEFANLGSVSLKRRAGGHSGGTNGANGAVQKVDMNRFLKNEKAPNPPTLLPGDVVTVPRNRMHSWRTAFTMIRDVSVVVSTYLLYRRVVN